MVPTSPPSGAPAVSYDASLPEPGSEEPLVDPQPSDALEQKFRRRAGIVPGIVPYVVPHPWLYHPFLFLSAPTVQAIDADLVSAICFVVARDNACRFCYGTFWAALRMAGYTKSDLDRLEGNLYLGERDAAEEAALRFAVRVSQGRLTAADGASVTRLRDNGWGRPATREIVGAAVLGTLVNRVSTMLAAPLNHRLEDMTASWYFDLLQPLVSPLLEGWQRLTPGAPALADDQVTGPLAPRTGTLRGTSIGYVLQDIANQWLHHEFAVPPRSKLLVLAVVARGLHDRPLERTAYDLLDTRTGLASDDAEAAVAHLRDASTPGAEAPLLQLARASIRYDATHLQRATRRYTEGLTRDEVLDTVASIALSNALGRLRVLSQVGTHNGDD